MPEQLQTLPVLRVAVPSPLRKEFDYLLPALSGGSSTSPDIKPGIRIKVPFGSRVLVGIVLAVESTTAIDRDKLRAAIELLDEEPVFDDLTLALYKWASNYYQFPLGQALQTSLPKFVREGRPLEIKPDYHWRLNPENIGNAEDSLKRSPRQKQLYELIKTYQHLASEEASALLDTSAGRLLQQLEEKDLIEKFLLSDSQLPDNPKHLPPLYTENGPLELNDEQAGVVGTILDHMDRFHCYLLEGITGSGKTEVYLHLIAEVLKAGKQVLVLIPEISLTPQTLSRFEQRFNRPVVALHSGLNDTERFTAWLQSRSGEAAIIIGTRSAIFTPLKNPGLIIVDEEHDSSYKQQDGFRYSGRDLAVFRARQLDIPVLLGSATPSLESLGNALSSNYSLLKLTRRAANASIPQFRFLDLCGQQMDEGFSTHLLEAIKSHLDQNNQVLIFINRRGFAPILQCHQCGWTATCPRCEIGYTLHQNPKSLSCHHCESSHRVPAACPECGGKELMAIGMGTERSETALKRLFPDTAILRIDRDNTRGKNAMQNMLDQVNTGKPCILTGTQMLAKGHHFPGVTLVAILDADSGLFSPDFRGQEQMGQLITQVSGRAGRGEKAGEVLIQTHHSDHPSLTALVKEGYGAFSRKLLDDRRTTGLPPFTHLVLVRAEASNPSLPEKVLRKARNEIENFRQAGTTLLGPIPAPMEKKAGRYRAQLLLKSGKRSELHSLSGHLIDIMESMPECRKVRWSIDVDPVDFL